jgi:hypothetical protein
LIAVRPLKCVIAMSHFIVGPTAYFAQNKSHYKPCACNSRKDSKFLGNPIGKRLHSCAEAELKL